MIIMAAALALATAPSGATPAGGNSVPFELYKGHIFVDAFVNGEGPFLFGFDTGASGIGRADSRLTDKLSLPRAGEKANSDGIKTVSSAVIQVASLRLGDVEKRDVKLISRDYNGSRKHHLIMGIIGRGFFADRLVAIDYPARQIRLSSGGLTSGAPGVLRYDEGFVVPICFRSSCYPAKIDTGSSRGIVVPEDIVAKLSMSTPVLLGTVGRTNSEAKLYEAKLKEPVGIGDITVTAEKILYTDPSVDFVNVGSEFLKDYVLTIDQRHHLLKISRPKD